MKPMTPAAADPEISTSPTPTTEPVEQVVPTASADPVTADDVGHPVSVGIGALGAGAAGAAIGAVGGPIGMLVGAVIGAVAGGLVGEEVAASGDQAATDNPDASYTTPDLIEPTSLATGATDFGVGTSSQLGSESLYSGADENTMQAEPEIPGAGSRQVQSAAREWASESAHASVVGEPVEIEPVGNGSELPAEASSAKPFPEDLVRTTAYYHYLQREAAGRDGDALGDWIEAERELQGA